METISDFMKIIEDHKCNGKEIERIHLRIDIAKKIYSSVKSRDLALDTIGNFLGNYPVVVGQMDSPEYVIVFK